MSSAFRLQSVLQDYEVRKCQVKPHSAVVAVQGAEVGTVPGTLRVCGADVLAGPTGFGARRGVGAGGGGSATAPAEAASDFGENICGAGSRRQAHGCTAAAEGPHALVLAVWGEEKSESLANPRAKAVKITLL